MTRRAPHRRQTWRNPKRIGSPHSGHESAIRAIETCEYLAGVGLCHSGNSDLVSARLAPQCPQKRAFGNNAAAPHRGQEDTPADLALAIITSVSIEHDN
jgi:hypothetical protein